MQQSTLSLVVGATLLIATPCVFQLRKPCHQRMSTLGIPSLMSKLFPPTRSTFTPHVGVTIVLLNLLAWTYSPEPPTALTKFTEKPGDVLLAAMSDHLIFHYLTCRWHTNPATTDYVHYRAPLPWTATMLTYEPFIFLLSTCPAEHAPHSHLLDTSSHPMTWSVQKSTKFVKQFQILFKNL